MDLRLHAELTDVRRQRALQQDAGDRLVVVESVDVGDELVLAGRGGKVVEVEADLHPLARAPLVADVDRGGGVVADVDRDEPQRSPAQGRALEADAFEDPRRQRLPVDQLRAHRP
jgi:hypothetical protein